MNTDKQTTEANKENQKQKQNLSGNDMIFRTRTVFDREGNIIGWFDYRKADQFIGLAKDDLYSFFLFLNGVPCKQSENQELWITAKKRYIFHTWEWGEGGNNRPYFEISKEEALEWLKKNNYDISNGVFEEPSPEMEIK